jgi:Zn-dependent protease with chaperone function
LQIRKQQPTNNYLLTTNKAMDFFEAQDRAKRNTFKLVVLYLLAVMGIIISIYVISLAIIQWQFGGFGGGLWSPGWLLLVTVVVFITIGIGTLVRVNQLRKGGSAVAELLGGRRVDPSTTDTDELRLMNIVEEMSIASGMPVPDVYVLDNEENINAFAAGFHTMDAAIGVTRGALEQLNRDEMQGVIAHEFSHIFNGDMKFNIRLIGILNGILLIHVMGMVIMRSMMYSGRSRRSSKDGGGNAALVIILVGLSLVIIGYIGMLFGRMIQSAISRQREYLADAAAVQYTRNPDGLAGALAKIGSKKKGAEIRDGHAMEMSHLFFASSYHSLFDRLYSTHPPIEKRIKAINPSMDLADERRKQKIREKFEKDHVAGAEKTAAPKPGGGLAGHAALTPEVILGAIGTLGQSHIRKAETIMDEISPELRKAAHEALSAEALIYAMILVSGMEKELPAWFEKEAGDGLPRETQKMMLLLEQGEREWFLPLADMAHGSLRGMSRKQYLEFRDVIRRLAMESNEQNLFAFAIEKIVDRKLKNVFASDKTPPIRHHNLKTLGNEMSVLISALAHLSGDEAHAAWDAGMEPIKKVAPETMKLLATAECGLSDLDTSLDELAATANPVKKFILSSVIHTVLADKEITIAEKELIRAISEALDCPIPIGAMAE